MRRRPILVGIVTLAIAVAFAVTSIVVGKSRSKNNASAPQQKVTKPDLPGTVDGNVNPELIQDHIAYTLANWDTDKSVRSSMEAELKRRNLEIRSTEGGFHVKDPDGFEVQMGGKKQ